MRGVTGACCCGWPFDYGSLPDVDTMLEPGPRVLDYDIHVVNLADLRCRVRVLVGLKAVP